MTYLWCSLTSSGGGSVSVLCMSPREKHDPVPRWRGEACWRRKDSPTYCDPQIFHFRPQLASANLPTLANDVKGLHAAACQFSKLFKHRV